MVKRLLEHVPTAVVAVAVVGAALAYGGYGLTARGVVAIVIWWAIVLGLGLALLPFSRPTREGYLSGGLLAALAVLAGLSVIWSATPERSFVEFDRLALYLGLFILAVLAGTRANVNRWADGLAIGIAVVGLLALTTRLFPGLVPGSNELSSISNRARLAFPLGYWNALGVLLALGYPLLLRTAVLARSALGRGLAVGVIPALSTAILLTFSRGAIGAALIGVAAFAVLAQPRLAAVWAVGCAGAGSALAVFIVTTQEALVDTPLRDVSVTAAQGRIFALFLLAACSGVAIAYLAGLAGARARGPSLPALRLGRRARLALGAVAAAALVGLVIAANPGQVIDSFKQADLKEDSQQGSTSQVLSASGGGRYQFWSAAIDQFEANPVLGDGAGAFEVWWAANPRLPYSVRDAHSLWLETLGELGLVGLVLLVGAVGYGLVTGIRRLRHRAGRERVLLAALCATVLAWAFAAAIDWMWEMTVVSAVAVVCLGLMTGPATSRLSPQSADPAPAGTRQGSRSFTVGIAVIAAAWLVICAQASPLLSEIRIDDSRAAAARGDFAAASEAARGARTLQPWAGSPLRQLAVVEEQRGRPAQALGYIREAIEREPGNYELWQIAARIERDAGDVAEARRSLERSRSLNPRPSAAATVTP